MTDKMTKVLHRAHARLLAGVQTLQKKQQELAPRKEFDELSAKIGDEARARQEAELSACVLRDSLARNIREVTELKERHTARLEEVRKQALAIGAQRCEEIETMHAQEHDVLMRRVNFLEEVSAAASEELL